MERRSFGSIELYQPAQVCCVCVYFWRGHASLPWLRTAGGRGGDRCYASGPAARSATRRRARVSRDSVCSASRGLAAISVDRARWGTEGQVLIAARRRFLREWTLGRIVRSLWSRPPVFSALFPKKENGLLEFRLIPPFGPQRISGSFAHWHAPLVPVSMATRSCLGCSSHPGPHPATSHSLHRPPA